MTTRKRMRDFSLDMYKELCRAFLRKGYGFLTVQEAVTGKGFRSRAPLVVIRHDVDRSLSDAVRMAYAENEMGVTASYYFRVPKTWRDEVVTEIASLGHEVGLHYECLDKAKGDVDKAARMLKEELGACRRVIDVRTAAMHGNPLTRHDNRDIWRHFALEDFGLDGEAYLSMDFSRYAYYSDTGRTWLEGVHNLKDYVPDSRGATVRHPCRTTDDLISLITHRMDNYYLTVHPERWSDNGFQWLTSFARDNVANMGKTVLCVLRRE